MDLKTKHEKLLYPAVRCFGKSGAGSGTVIYSKEDPKNEGEYLSFVLTNHHVVADLITVKDKWNSVLKRTTKGEIIDKAKVEVFSYHSLSTVDSSNRFTADIVAYDDHHDLAILKMESPRKFEYVAPILPEEKIKQLRLYMDVAVTGCSMAHEPFTNFGQITFLSEEIEQKQYLMTNASSVFGNSGGSLYLVNKPDMEEFWGYLIGVPSRITAIQLGFGVDILTWMGFSAHTSRLYDFFRDQHLSFLFDDSKTYYDAIEARKEQEEKSLVQLQVEAQKELQGCKSCK